MLVISQHCAGLSDLIIWLRRLTKVAKHEHKDIALRSLQILRDATCGHLASDTYPENVPYTTLFKMTCLGGCMVQEGQSAMQQVRQESA